MKAHFNQCDAVLIPYKNTESSSGIIGHAASSQKPVITINKGLLGDIVKQYKLGWLIEESSPVFIADGIRKCISKKFPKINSEEYLKAHTAIKFATSIVES